MATARARPPRAAAARALGALALLASLAHAEREQYQDELGPEGEPVGRLRRFARLAAFGADLEEWEAAVDRNRDVEHESLAEEWALVELGAAGETIKWPRSWVGRLRSDAIVVGKGAFGKVYVASVGCDGSKVAVKKMVAAPKTADDEAALLRAFSRYPNFVAYFDHKEGQEDAAAKGKKTYYLMMESALGGDFTHIIDGRRQATLQQKHELFYGMLTGIKEMHDKGIIHRDLKPANVFISKSCGGSEPCIAKVGDLGLACQLPGRGQSSRALASVPPCTGMAGTPVYIAPETYSSGAIEPGNDVWALGLMLYELTFKSLPKSIRDSRTMSELASRVKRFNIATDPNLQSLQPGALRDLMQAMLALQPHSRLSASDALEKASALVGRRPASVPAASLPECFYTGKRPGAPARAAAVSSDIREIEAQGKVDYLTMGNVKTNIMVSYLFNHVLIDPKTGVVVDKQKQLPYLHQKRYFPKALARGVRVLEINGKPYTGIDPLARRGFQEGLYGSLVVKYEKP